MHAKAVCAVEGPILVGIIVLLGFCHFACGIKRPPVPPRQPPVPAVTDLACQVADRSVTLNWRLPGPLSGKQAKQATFGLYRFRTALEQPLCDGCPMVFEKAATIPYVYSETNRFYAAVPLDFGYRYLFKVRLETDGGAGPDSNSVQFDHLPDNPPGVSKPDETDSLF